MLRKYLKLYVSTILSVSILMTDTVIHHLQYIIIYKKEDPIYKLYNAHFTALNVALLSALPKKVLIAALHLVSAPCVPLVSLEYFLSLKLSCETNSISVIMLAQMRSALHCTDKDCLSCPVIAQPQAHGSCFKLCHSKTDTVQDNIQPWPPKISQNQLGSVITHGHTAFFNTDCCTHNCISL